MWFDDWYADGWVWADVDDLLGLSLSPVLMTSSLRRFLDGVGDSLRTIEALGVFMIREPSISGAPEGSPDPIALEEEVAAVVDVVVVPGCGEEEEGDGSDFLPASSREVSPGSVCRMTLMPAMDGAASFGLFVVVVVGVAAVAAVPGELFLSVRSGVAVAAVPLEAAFDDGGDKRGGVLVAVVAAVVVVVAAGGGARIPELDRREENETLLLFWLLLRFGLWL